MKRNASVPAALLTGLLAAAWGASPAQAAPETWHGTGQVEFHATSTLKDFSGTAPVEPFHFLVEAHPETVTAGGTATVAVAVLDSRHAKRDANMRRMFDADRFPLVSGVLPLSPLDPAAPDGVPLRLTIRDRTQEVPARVSEWTRQPDRIEFNLEFTVSLQAFDLSPPVFMGFLRVGDAVQVHVRVVLTNPAST